MTAQESLRTTALIGQDGLETLKGKCVAVFGIGGVGSFAVEALARSGVGTLYLYDHDTVSPSNCNRQLIALPSTVGQKKVELAAKRCREINADITVHAVDEFVTPDSDLPFQEFDFIVDAVDNVTAKLFLIENAKRKKIPIVSVMGTGNKLDPTALRIGDIYKTRNCPLARVMRTELRKRRIEKLPVVWSDEVPKTPTETEELRQTGRPTPASMCFVPSCAGIAAASYVVKTLLK